MPIANPFPYRRTSRHPRSRLPPLRVVVCSRFTPPLHPATRLAWGLSLSLSLVLRSHHCRRHRRRPFYTQFALNLLRAPLRRTAPFESPRSTTAMHRRDIAISRTDRSCPSPPLCTWPGSFHSPVIVVCDAAGPYYSRARASRFPIIMHAGEVGKDPFALCRDSRSARDRASPTILLPGSRIPGNRFTGSGTEIFYRHLSLR